MTGKIDGLSGERKPVGRGSGGHASMRPDLTNRQPERTVEAVFPSDIVMYWEMVPRRGLEPPRPYGH